VIAKTLSALGRLPDPSDHGLRPWTQLALNRETPIIGGACHVPLHFYARQLYRLSVCLPVCLSVTTRWYTKHRWDRDSGSSPYGSLEYLVSYEVIWCRWMRRFSSGIKKGYPLRNRNFTTIGSSSVETVADRHRLAANHNKHCRRAFQ